MFIPPNSSQSTMAQIGFGPLRTNPCFRFDMISFEMGCNTMNASRCEFNIAGLRYDPDTDDEVEVASFPLVFNSCSRTNFTNCTLGRIDLGRMEPNLTNLSSITIDYTGDESGVWFGDDFHFRWTNDTCEAGLCRSAILDRTLTLNQKRSTAKLLDSKRSSRTGTENKWEAVPMLFW